MFTGLIEEVGTVTSSMERGQGRRLTVKATLLSPELRPGDSLAVNGCCLTVAHRENGSLEFDLLAETLNRTNLGAARAGTRVNLERPLPAGGRLGGHFVQGHVDGTARVSAYERDGTDFRLQIELPEGRSRYMVEKGSIAVDGISLTVARVTERDFIAWIIPHTCAHTNLSQLQPGALVNLEFDVLAKYVERLLPRAGFVA